MGFFRICLKVYRNWYNQSMSIEREEPRPRTEAIWDRLEIKAPPNFEPVYHSVAKDSLTHINENGLHASEHRAELPEEIVFEKALPDHLAEQGATRTNAVFASLVPMPNYYGGHREGEDYAILEMMVDPKKAFVAYWDYVSAVVIGRVNEEAIEAARKYWDHCVTLEEYLMKPEAHTYIERFRNHTPMDPYGGGPEVIIPGGIEQKYIREFAERNPMVGEEW